jgi:hypothetical protein
MSLDGVIESPEEWSSPFFSDEMGRDLIIRDADMEELKAKGDGDFHITGSGTLVRNWIRRGLSTRSSSRCASFSSVRVSDSSRTARACRRRSGAGAHQFQRPSSCISEGTRRAGMMLASDENGGRGAEAESLRDDDLRAEEG